MTRQTVLYVCLFGLILFACKPQHEEKSPSTENIHQGEIALVIHGGAGTILKENMTPQLEAEYQAKLQEAVKLGYTLLQEGKSSLDAVEAVLRILEDSPLFNAGKGAVFTNDERNELDASIMDGATLNAGAIAGVTRVKNPISLARKVMERSEHVFLIGSGAELFAEQQKIELVDPSYFFDQKRYDHLQKIKKQETNKQLAGTNHDHKFGTVGCVALDKNGNLAAGTSTGGMTNKQFGRVGDVPVIGAGTYANNRSCAVSATGWGEYFIRSVVAHDISALVEYKGWSVKEAAKEVIWNKVAKLGGDGGVIVIDRKGNIAMEFNTAGMYRASIDSKGTLSVGIYK
jgi:beta-aspartyl-peptidase (threonine type)